MIRETVSVSTETEESGLALSGVIRETGLESTEAKASGFALSP